MRVSSIKESTQKDGLYIRRDYSAGNVATDRQRN